ncbi:mannosyltransferase [Clostridium gelidum]|uniref:Mannosyltransferase n=1 Tax=Clostridium gelidum TaxID=704125 RepID=A0ABN6IY86_9CLOT|nr:glycosyltransferase family 1 protein [Clostridium gelidum]BCZ47100.1 mannosyltransferase [Clostridium gelidum]
MKKVIINGRFLTRKVTGVERYAREITLELDKLSKPGQYLIAVPKNAVHIPNFQNIKVVKIGSLTNRLWEHISFSIYVIRQKAISLNLCNAAPFLNPGIVCVHDIKPIVVPQYFSKKFLLLYKMLFFNVFHRAKIVITVSEFSKSEILKFYNYDSNKVYVIPSAWQHFKKINFDERVLKKYQLKKNEYYFSMSSLEPNKNFKWIIKQAINNSTSEFVIAGSVNNNVFANNDFIEKPANVKFLGYIGDEEAKTLMRDCKAFLFPTFYEGFGLPPLEAMSVGAKAIVSNTKCMHEVYGDTVFYIDPYNYNIDLAALLKNNVEDSGLIMKKYSFEKSAQMLKKLLLDL